MTGSRILLAGLIAGALFAAAADPTARAEETDAGAGLRVERVTWKADGRGGGVIEVHYRLVGITELPRHPSITYVLDETTMRRVELRRVAMLPPTSMSAEGAPLATLVLPDESGIVRPGQQVTVVVAGLVQRGVIVEGLAAEDVPPPSDGPSPAGPATEPTTRLEVVKLMIAGHGALLDLRYRLSGASIVHADEHDSYVELPASGDKLYVLGVARIGTLATKDAGPSRTSFILIQNSERKIKAGDRVNVVIAGARQDDVLVEE